MCSCNYNEGFYGFSRFEHRSSGSLEIITNPTGLGKVLLDALPLLKQDYKSHPLIVNRHQETIFAAFFRSLPNVVFRRECLRMHDNGTVALDWPVGGSDCDTALRWKSCLNTFGRAPEINIWTFSLRSLVCVQKHFNNENFILGKLIKRSHESNALLSLCICYSYMFIMANECCGLVCQDKPYHKEENLLRKT